MRHDIDPDDIDPEDAAMAAQIIAGLAMIAVMAAGLGLVLLLKAI